MDNNQNSKKTTQTIADMVKEVLATQIGVEPDDINNEDLLYEDLHMSPTDVSDFINELGKKGLETKDIEITDVESVEDILERLSVLDLMG